MDNISTPLTCQRAHFDIPDGVVFLNAASKSALPTATVDAGRSGAAAKGRPWSIDEPGRYIQADDIRARFARLIGAGADDIAIQPAASYGVATAARNLTVGAGRRIVVLEGQFPSNVYAWRNLASESDAELVTVAWPEDDDWTRAVLDVLDERVAIAALPPCHWTDGTILDLARASHRIHELGATFVVDATQWIGAQPIDVKALGVDYLVCAAYKWLLGPYGLSLFYVAPHRQNGRPLEEHLFNHGGVDSITTGLGYPDAFTDGARRFDAGQFLSLTNLPMIQTSLELVERWSPERIGAYLGPLTNAIAEGARDLGLVTAPAALRSPHILGLRRAGGFPADISARLEAQGIYVSSRGGAIRVSPYLFNDADDGTRFLEALDAALNQA